MGSLFSSNHTTEEVVSREVVTARTIYNTLNDLTSYLVILDLRSTSAFKESHIDLAVNPSCLNDMLRHTQQSPFTTVIIYGESKCNEDEEAKLFQFCTLMNRHRIKEQEGPLRVLHMHDFASFYAEYPFQCTNHARYEEGRLYPSQIVDNIFLSNFGVASSKKVTNTLSVTHILNCTKDCPFVGEVYDVADSAQALNAAINPLDTGPCPTETDGVPLSSSPSASTSTSTMLLARIPVIDEKDQQIHEHFDNAIQFLSSMGPTDRAIIHCKHGQSRSATVAAAYLIHKYDWGVTEALDHLKACRPKVCPNEGFISQLHKFAEQRKVFQK